MLRTATSATQPRSHVATGFSIDDRVRALTAAIHVHAMLLCAGLGTRLRPLTNERPKPLVPLLGRPIAAYALDRLAHAGVRSVVANTFHLPHLVAPTLEPIARSLRMSFDTVNETVLLGTGGGIRNALPKLGNEPFFVFNGDILAAPALDRALSLHRATSARMTMILREDPRADSLGSIDVDDEGRVRRILGEGPEPAVKTKRCMFTGVYVLSPDVRDDLPENGCIVRHSLRRWLARGDRVSAIVDDGPWLDLGTIATYASATFAMLDGTLKLPTAPATNSRSRVANSATIDAGVRVGAYVDVGESASLRGVGDVSRAIVWDGATLDAPAHNVIVTASGARVAIE